MRLWMLGLLALSTLGGCADDACGGAACLPGLTIQFTGGDDGVVYDVDIGQVTSTSEVLPAMRCRVTQTAERWDLFCSSQFVVHQEAGNMLLIPSTHFQDRIVVAISAGGELLSEQALDVVYSSTELPGRGECGSCTSAGVLDVALPPRQP